MHDIRVHPSAGSFLAVAEDWLRRHEDRNNLVLGLAYARAMVDEVAPSSVEPEQAEPFYATVERGSRLVGCVLRTPPHKVLLTDMPVEAAPAVAAALSRAFDRIPAVLGPPAAAEAVAVEWVALRGGGWRPGMEQRVYRVDEVVPVTGVSGRMRVAGPADLDLAVRWSEGFARDTGVRFGTSREVGAGWIEREALHIWQDGDASVSIAVAQGRTPRGIRVGYVYTPLEHRRRGYATALVAALSEKLLGTEVDFCVLYSDLSNPTSNAIYRRLGYEPIQDVRDVDLVAEEEEVC